MQSALIVHSKHTKRYAQAISKKYKDVKFLEIRKPPTAKTLNIKNNKNVVIGVGGGSVIDAAKIISKNKRCIAIPTTCAGASATAYATFWGKLKKSVSAKKPMLKMDYSMKKNLPFSVQQSTVFDALSHAIESFWSKNATVKSKRYSKKAIKLIKKYFKKDSHHLSRNDINELIVAGNIAGQAIAIAKTNVVHAMSYPITIKYGIDHGAACGMVLPYIVEYMDFKKLPKLFNLNSNKKLAKLLKKSFIPPKIKNFNVKIIANETIKYNKVNDGPRKIDKKALLKILSLMKVDTNRER